MKKIILSIAVVITLMLPKIAAAQTSFSFMQDTVYATISAGTSSATSVFDNYVNNSSSGSLTLVWHVTATNFPADWLSASVFGLCDNITCYNNNDDMQLWNDTSDHANLFDAAAVASSDTGNFDLSICLAGTTTPGTHWVTVSFYPSGAPGSAKSITFVINRTSTAAVQNVPNTENVVLYPNPASSEVNLVYDASADVKSIAVYNIIGKIQTIYKVTDNSSANLNIDNLSSGIYFVRLMNSRGEVVVTRKFTKQ